MKASGAVPSFPFRKRPVPIRLDPEGPCGLAKSRAYPRSSGGCQPHPYIWGLAGFIVLFRPAGLASMSVRARTCSVEVNRMIAKRQGISQGWKTPGFTVWNRALRGLNGSAVLSASPGEIRTSGLVGMPMKRSGEPFPARRPRVWGGWGGGSATPRTQSWRCGRGRGIRGLASLDPSHPKRSGAFALRVHRSSRMRILTRPPSPAAAGRRWIVGRRDLAASC